MDFKTYLIDQKKIIEEALEFYMLKAEGEFSEHIKAMRYSLYAGGKRIRPILCLAAARMVGGESFKEDASLSVACALECIHTYSLIHDDLPAMDNDDLRRGKPTSHTVYGDAAAILAGDGLQCFAFDLLSNPEYGAIEAQARLKIIAALSRAAGPLGMVGGQSLDVMHEGQKISFEQLQKIHRSKTGALITASLLAGGITAGATDNQCKALEKYGNNVGLAFQIIDDILNVESTSEQLGKAAGSDAKRGKATYPAFFGIEKSRNMATDAVNNAIHALDHFDTGTKPLRELALFIIYRNN